MRIRWIHPLAAIALALAAPGTSPSASATTLDPLATAAGIFKLGTTEGAGSVGVPYQLSDGTRAVLTAKHGVSGIDGTHWPIVAADGSTTTGQVVAMGVVDAALIRSSTQWAAPPPVMLADDLSARFSAVANSTADVPVGTRVCRTGWSPLSNSTGPGGGSPNFGAPPDVQSSGGHVVCGRVVGSSSTQIVIGQSDRPDGAVAARGDSGGAVWKVTNDGGFMFLGIMTGMHQVGCGPITGSALLACDQAVVLPAWQIGADPSLAAAPMTHPYPTPFLTIDPSTYRPTTGGSVILRGSLRSPDNQPLASQSVTLLGGSPLTAEGTAVTDSQGNFSFTTGPIVGARAFAFRWPGNATTPPVASRVLSVGSTRVDRTAAPTSVIHGQPLAVTARATDSTGRPVVGRPMELRSYDPAAGMSILATALTDANGEATLVSGPLTQPLTYALRIEGDNALTNGNPAGAAASSIVTVPIT